MPGTLFIPEDFTGTLITSILRLIAAYTIHRRARDTVVQVRIAVLPFLAVFIFKVLLFISCQCGDLEMFDRNVTQIKFMNSFIHLSACLDDKCTCRCRSAIYFVKRLITKDLLKSRYIQKSKRFLITRTVGISTCLSVRRTALRPHNSNFVQQMQYL